QEAKIWLDRGTRIVGPCVENRTIARRTSVIEASAILPARGPNSRSGQCSHLGRRSEDSRGRATGASVEAAVAASTRGPAALEASAEASTWPESSRIGR